jgi:hypothetical protein
MLPTSGRTRDTNLVLDASADSVIPQPAPINNEPTGKATVRRGTVESPAKREFFRYDKNGKPVYRPPFRGYGPGETVELPATELVNCRFGLH